MPKRPGITHAVVALEAVEGDVRAAIRNALEVVEWRKAIPAGASVSLKVNLGWDLFIPGSITSPLVAESLILEIRDHVGRIYMVEADQVLEDVEKAFYASGMAAVCQRQGVQWVNMSRSPTVPVDAASNSVLKRVDVPKILMETQLITVPVMKTHAKTGITGAIKNQWGCLGTMRHEYHLVLDDALADLNSVVRPSLCLMDATVCLEGNGPKSGKPKLVNRVLCSTDPVALDTVQARIMGIDPESLPFLRICAERGIGTNRRQEIEIRGARLEDSIIEFLPARHNAVSSVETILRRSVFKRIFFNTPVFHLCLYGAKLYYRLWTALEARTHWHTIRSHPLYGPQWSPDWRGP